MGATGNTKAEICYLCHKPMVAREYELLGRLLWTRVHDACSDRYHEFKAKEIDFPIKKASIPDPHWENLIKREKEETSGHWWKELDEQ